MHSRSSHRIQRQFLEVEFGETEDGFGLQDRLAELYYDRLQPAMEALMDERFGENATLLPTGSNWTAGS
jgi:hypothetical protein